MRQLLKNAKIYDGTGAEPYQADILLKDDRIAKITGSIDLPADQVYDLAGKSVSSGFIDATPITTGLPSKRIRFPISAPSCVRESPPSSQVTAAFPRSVLKRAIPIRTNWAAEFSVSGKPPANTAQRKHTSGQQTGRCPAIWRCWPVTVLSVRQPEAWRTGR